MGEGLAPGGVSPSVSSVAVEDLDRFGESRGEGDGFLAVESDMDRHVSDVDHSAFRVCVDSEASPHTSTRQIGDQDLVGHRHGYALPAFSAAFAAIFSCTSAGVFSRMPPAAIANQSSAAPGLPATLNRPSHDQPCPSAKQTE